MEENQLSFFDFNKNTTDLSKFKAEIKGLLNSDEENLLHFDLDFRIERKIEYNKKTKKSALEWVVIKHYIMADGFDDESWQVFLNEKNAIEDFYAEKEFYEETLRLQQKGFWHDGHRYWWKIDLKTLKVGKKIGWCLENDS